MTIRRSLLLAFLLFSVLFAASMALLAYTRSRAALDAEIRLNLATQAETLTQQVAAALFERLQDIHGWQRLDVMQEVKVGDVDKRLARYLHEVQAAYGGIYSDLVCVAGDQVVAASDAALIGSRYAAPPAWLELRYQGDAVTLSRPAPQDGRRLMDLRLAIPDAFGGAPLGAIHARYDWGEIDAALARVATGGREALLLDAGGVVLASSPRLRTRIAGAAPVVLPAGQTPAGGGVIEVDGGSSGMGRLLVGVARVGAYRALPDLGWSVAVLTPERVALAPVRALLWWLLVALAAIVTVAAALAMILSARTAGPILALARYTRELGRDLDAPMRTIAGSSEIVELCAAFNRMIEDLKRSRVHLVRASKLAAVGEMAARLAHEVRTPLGIIRSSAQLVSRQPGLDETGHEMMSFMINECDRMNDLVTGLLDSARPREPVLAPEDFHAIAHHVAELLRDRLAAREIRLDLALDADSPTVACDRGQMIQVLINLLVNALQASPAGSRLLVSTSSDGDEFRVTIDDEGPGIAPARREEILEPFVSDRAGGIGLGLSIVREIVVMHRGRLTIDDSPLGGARFTIQLPRSAGTRRMNPD
jgi:signal transduction histidine kinase